MWTNIVTVGNSAVIHKYKALLFVHFKVQT